MPDWKTEIRQWLHGLNLAPLREAEIVDELAEHVQDRYEEFLADGLTEAAAARTALAELSESELLTRELRRVERSVRVEPATSPGAGPVIANLRQDLRYAARMLFRKPGFTLIAAFTLALGIGANTAIFTVVNAVLLRPLPYPASEELMEIGRVFPTDPQVSALSESKFIFVRDNLQSFEAITATQAMGSNTYLSDENTTEYINGLIVTADFFRVLGVSPAIGRGFTNQEDSPAGERVVILGDGFWRRRFGSEPGIIGRTISLNGDAVTVVGIMPPGFEYFGPRDVFVPMRVNPEPSGRRTELDSHWASKTRRYVGPGECGTESNLAEVPRYLSKPGDKD